MVEGLAQRSNGIRHQQPATNRPRGVGMSPTSRRQARLSAEQGPAELAACQQEPTVLVETHLERERLPLEQAMVDTQEAPVALDTGVQVDVLPSREVLVERAAHVQRGSVARGARGACSSVQCVPDVSPTLPRLQPEAEASPR